MLVQAVGRCGGGPGQKGFSWPRVAEPLGGGGGGMLGRSAEQCRSRWLSHIQPMALGESTKQGGGVGSAWSVHEVRSETTLTAV